MVKKMRKTTDIDKSCFTCKYLGVEDIWHECECEKTGLTVDYDSEGAYYSICDDYVPLED